MKSVGAYEAKTKLPELLAAVARGETIIITRHGVPIARLVPATNGQEISARQAIEELKRLRKGRRLQGVTIRELIEEGRRY